MARWIKLEKRRPKQGQAVIVTLSSERMLIKGKHPYDRGFWCRSLVTVAKLDPHPQQGNRFVELDQYGNPNALVCNPIDSLVIAWKPLPSPYRTPVQHLQRAIDWVKVKIGLGMCGLSEKCELRDNIDFNAGFDE